MNLPHRLRLPLSGQDYDISTDLSEPIKVPGVKDTYPIQELASAFFET